MINHDNFGSGRVGKVRDRCSGQTSHPEERIYLAVLHGVHRLGSAQALTLDVLVFVDASSLKQAERHDFGRTARAARAHTLSFQVLHGLDPRGLGGDHMHAVWIQNSQRLYRNLTACELAFSGRSILGRVRHGETNIGLARRNQVQVID